MDITLENLQQLFPLTSADTLNRYVVPLNTILPEYEIITNLRIAMFLAQVGVESAHFNAIEGNFNYSAQGLWKNFRTHFTSYEECLAYAHQPEKIVNRVYSNRMGNGPETSGDAWTYRERGLLQLCGKDNYLSYAKYKNMTVEDTITYLGTTNGVLDVACWFFKVRKINAVADKGNVKGVTKLINGGYIGLDERTTLYALALKIFPT